MGSPLRSVRFNEADLSAQSIFALHPATTISRGV